MKTVFKMIFGLVLIFFLLSLLGFLFLFSEFFLTRETGESLSFLLKKTAWYLPSLLLVLLLLTLFLFWFLFIPKTDKKGFIGLVSGIWMFLVLFCFIEFFPTQDLPDDLNFLKNLKTTEWEDSVSKELSSSKFWVVQAPTPWIIREIQAFNGEFLLFFSDLKARNWVFLFLFSFVYVFFCCFFHRLVGIFKWSILNFLVGINLFVVTIFVSRKILGEMSFFFSSRIIFRDNGLWIPIILFLLFAVCLNLVAIVIKKIGERKDEN